MGDADFSLDRDQSSDRWHLTDAGARFSDLVRRVRSEGPQHVIVQGEDDVVVMAAEEFRRLTQAELDRAATGDLLVSALQASPFREVEIEPERSSMPVRDVAS